MRWLPELATCFLKAACSHLQPCVISLGFERWSLSAELQDECAQKERLTLNPYTLTYSYSLNMYDLWFWYFPLWNRRVPQCTLGKRIPQSCWFDEGDYFKPVKETLLLSAISHNNNIISMYYYVYDFCLSCHASFLTCMLRSRDTASHFIKAGVDLYKANTISKQKLVWQTSDIKTPRLLAY